MRHHQMLGRLLNGYSLVNNPMAVGAIQQFRRRDLPTLATILALQSVAPTRAAHAIATGLAFLRAQARHWAGPLTDDIPVGLSYCCQA